MRILKDSSKWANKENVRHISEPVVIDKDLCIGVGTIILKVVTLKNHAVIGSNTVANKDVPPYAIVGDVPAKK
jgi:acetyltransferase-like isoleucine patch superfamily enzyme